MLRIVLSLSALCACAGPAVADPILLREGERVEYVFEPSGFFVVGPAVGSDGISSLSILFGLGDLLNPGEAFFFELFENATDLLPFSSHLSQPTVVSFRSISSTGGGFQDFEGRIAFTQVAGSVELESVRLFANRGGLRYEADLRIIPEPGTAALLLLAVPGLLLTLMYRQRPSGLANRSMLP